MGHGFEVKINDEQPIRAGLGAENYVVTCILNAVLRRDSFEEELDITISGLDSVDDVHVDWLKTELRPGDTIQITVVGGDYDPPRNTRPRITEKDIIVHKLRYYYALKEELKEHLQG
ncbi:hypothetical protein GCM10007423_31600 [Dyadobacter endophyticus]|uniref:Uncharacterized protein n=2 Tax=Spirosomataceae TaxID=2896860 RepID=A0ABQ1YVI1_9BACT|nr:hypothetical protein GCM10007423_31600 [Dyadobacter endophyticus]